MPRRRRCACGNCCCCEERCCECGRSHEQQKALPARTHNASCFATTIVCGRTSPGERYITAYDEADADARFRELVLDKEWCNEKATVIQQPRKVSQGPCDPRLLAGA